MEEWLHLVTKDVVVIIDAMALIVVAIGTAGAFLTGLWVAFPAPASHSRFREILVLYGRWFATSIAPGWQELGQLGAIAVIRTLFKLFPGAGLGRAWRPSR
jgi:hypothetical protein